MIEASTRMIGMSEGKAACSIASLSMVSQKSSTCTSSGTEPSGQMNCTKVKKYYNCAILLIFLILMYDPLASSPQHFSAPARCLCISEQFQALEQHHKCHRSYHCNHALSNTQKPSIHSGAVLALGMSPLDSVYGLQKSRKSSTYYTMLMYTTDCIMIYKKYFCRFLLG